MQPGELNPVDAMAWLIVGGGFVALLWASRELAREVLMELAWLARLPDLRRRMQRGGDRPLRDLPDWLVGYVIHVGFRADPHPTWRRVFTRQQFNLLYVEAATEYRIRKGQRDAPASAANNRRST